MEWEDCFIVITDVFTRLCLFYFDFLGECDSELIPKKGAHGLVIVMPRIILLVARKIHPKPRTLGHFFELRIDFERFLLVRLTSFENHTNSDVKYSHYHVYCER